MLEIRSLSLVYRYKDRSVKILDSIDISVDRGEVVAVYGDRHSGKYYLVRTVTGLVEPSSGEVYVDGRRVDYKDRRGLNRLRRRVQTYFMDVSRSVPAGMTVRSYLDWLAGEFGARDGVGTVSSLLQRLGVPQDILDRRVYSLPLHQLYIIYVSSGLMAGPSYMILENPTGLIHYPLRGMIAGLIRVLAGEYGVGILYTTSDAGLFRELGVRKHVLYRGRVIESGGPELGLDPLHPYAERELGVDGPSDVVDSIYVSEGLPKLYDWSRCPFIPECPHASGDCEADIPMYRRGDRMVRCVLYR